MEEKDIEELIEESRKYAESKGYKLNSNEAIVRGVIKGLLARQENFGEKYCPCRKMAGNKEEDRKIICPCIYHEKEIEEDGHCFCNLFVK